MSKAVPDRAVNPEAPPANTQNEAAAADLEENHEPDSPDAPGAAYELCSYSVEDDRCCATAGRLNSQGSLAVRLRG